MSQASKLIQYGYSDINSECEYYTWNESRTQKSDIPESTNLTKAIKISLIKQNVTEIHIPSKLFKKNPEILVQRLRFAYA